MNMNVMQAWATNENPLFRKLIWSSRKAVVLHLFSFAISSKNPRFSVIDDFEQKDVYSVVEDMTK